MPAHVCKYVTHLLIQLLKDNWHYPTKVAHTQRYSKQNHLMPRFPASKGHVFGQRIPTIIPLLHHAMLLWVLDARNPFLFPGCRKAHPSTLGLQQPLLPFCLWCSRNRNNATLYGNLCRKCTITDELGVNGMLWCLVGHIMCMTGNHWRVLSREVTYFTQ